MFVPFFSYISRLYAFGRAILRVFSEIIYLTVGMCDHSGCGLETKVVLKYGHYKPWKPGVTSVGSKFKAILPLPIWVVETLSLG